MTEKKFNFTLSLSESTFQHLEAVAYAQFVNERGIEGLAAGHDAKHDNFRPLVKNLLCKIIDSIEEGIRRPLSNERMMVEALTGWDGSYYPLMLGDKVRIGHTFQTEMIEYFSNLLEKNDADETIRQLAQQKLALYQQG
jgi:hypothetical protein